MSCSSRWSGTTSGRRGADPGPYPGPRAVHSWSRTERRPGQDRPRTGVWTALQTGAKRVLALLLAWCSTAGHRCSIHCSAGARGSCRAVARAPRRAVLTCGRAVPSTSRAVGDTVAKWVDDTPGRPPSLCWYAPCQNPAPTLHHCRSTLPEPCRFLAGSRSSRTPSGRVPARFRQGPTCGKAGSGQGA